jgi:hypothetical protein
MCNTWCMCVTGNPSACATVNWKVCVQISDSAVFKCDSENL